MIKELRVSLSGPMALLLITPTGRIGTLTIGETQKIAPMSEVTMMDDGTMRTVGIVRHISARDLKVCSWINAFLFSYFPVFLYTNFIFCDSGVLLSRSLLFNNYSTSARWI